jgi:hypothetical protein
MVLVKWEPLREIEDMFDRYTSKLGWPALNREAFSTTEWAPRIDITETDKEFTIKAELPEVRNAGRLRCITKQTGGRLHDETASGKHIDPAI